MCSHFVARHALQVQESMRDEIRQLQSAQSDLLHEHIRELQEENSWLVSHYGEYPWCAGAAVCSGDRAVDCIGGCSVTRRQLPTALHTEPILCL